MFEVDTHSSTAHSLTFARQPNGMVKGGWQGGRGWQVSAKDINNTQYLTSPSWMIENAKSLLDAPNEFYFDAKTNEYTRIPPRCVRIPLENLCLYCSCLSNLRLYLWPNASSKFSASPQPPSLQYAAVQLDTLISMNSTMAAPIKDVTIQGLSFRDAADVTVCSRSSCAAAAAGASAACAATDALPPLPALLQMKPWAVPSGGDWGLYRGGAIFLEGVENVSVTDSLFERIDGNAIMVSGEHNASFFACFVMTTANSTESTSVGYTRHVSITDNEAVWLGLSFAAGWGYTREQDGTDGQQPRYTKLARNVSCCHCCALARLPSLALAEADARVLPFQYVHEIGIIEKQSSMWFQAKTCLSEIEDNVSFNQPRAGELCSLLRCLLILEISRLGDSGLIAFLTNSQAINFNDGFGGGTNASGNVLFNTCRETGDHGPINSWGESDPVPLNLCVVLLTAADRSPLRPQRLPHGRQVRRRAPELHCADKQRVPQPDHRQLRREPRL